MNMPYWWPRKEKVSATTKTPSEYRSSFIASCLLSEDYKKGKRYIADPSAFSDCELPALFASAAFQLGCLHGQGIDPFRGAAQA